MQATNETPIGIEYIKEKGDGSYYIRFQCEPVSWRDEPISSETAAMIIEHALSNGIVRDIDEMEAKSGEYFGKPYNTPSVTKYILEENELGAMLDQAAVETFARWNSSTYDDSQRRSIITGRFK